jgi:hypothetical protein
MPIRITEGPEPLSAVALERKQEIILIESDSYRILADELRRYCRREVTGRSFLIAGQRGSGKTTTVANAFLQVLGESERGQTRLRPLLILLHGPSLFPDAVASRPSEDHVPKSASAGSSPSDGADADASSEGMTIAGSSSTNHSKTDAEQALEQIILCLHRAVSHEFSMGFRRFCETQVRRTQTAIGVAVPEQMDERAARLRELAVAFEYELDECPDANRLRWYWAEAGALGPGILPQGDRGSETGLRRDSLSSQGTLELLALSGMSDAYRRISGTYNKQSALKDRSERENQASITLDSANRAIYAPLASLLTGGLVGTGLYAATHGGPLSVLGGIGAALTSSTIMKYSSTSTRRREATREYSFLFDLSAATLDRILPVLIERLVQAGLAPIFMVDELDKVRNLPDRILGMVHHLKKLVAENAFFCFLTDRVYFEAVVRRGERIAYPVEYTYYTHRLFIAFSPEDLHAYLEGREASGDKPRKPGVFSITDDPDTNVSPTALENSPNAPSLPTPSKYSTDIPLLSYVLLYRSRMHALDLRREIAALRSEEGQALLQPGMVRTDKIHRLHVQIQLAIEIVLETTDLAGKVAADSSYRRLAHDALYFIASKWARSPEPIDLSDAGLPAFVQYLVDRVGQDGAATSNDTHDNHADDTLSMSRNDQIILFDSVRYLAALLSHVALYTEAFKLLNSLRQERRLKPVDNAVMEALSLDDDNLLLIERSTHVYDWRYTTTGEAFTKVQWAPVMDTSALRTDITFIRAFERLLAEVSR